MLLGYVVGPFRGATHWEICENVRVAERLGLMLARQGIMPLIPHKNSENFHGQCTDKFWLEGTMEFLRRCDFAITVEAVGMPWRHSSDSCAEVEEMMNLGRSVFHDFEALESFARLWLLSKTSGL